MTSESVHVAIVFNHDYDEKQSDYAARADVEKTAHAVAAGIATHPNVRTTLIAVGADPLAAFAELRALRPDVVFNLCESLCGGAEHETIIPALCALYGIRYTGCSPFTLAAALRKDQTKALLTAAGVPTPPAVVLSAPPEKAPPFAFPMIVKPLREDGSLGISARSVVHDLRALQKQVAALRSEYDQPVLVEKYIEGKELNVPLLDGFVLPWSEIDFSRMPKGMPEIITYRGKWDDNSDEYKGSMPKLDPKLPPAVRERVTLAAERAFKALECRGYARVDVRVDKRGQPFVIDINPNCDLSPHGGFFKAVKAAHLSYADMVLHITELALGAKLVPPHSQDVPSRFAAAVRTARAPPRLQPGRTTRRARAR